MALFIWNHNASLMTQTQNWSSVFPSMGRTVLRCPRKKTEFISGYTSFIYMIVHKQISIADVCATYSSCDLPSSGMVSQSCLYWGIPDKGQSSQVHTTYLHLAWHHRVVYTEVFQIKDRVHKQLPIFYTGKN